MQFQNDRHPWNVRGLLESTATPFTIADYGPRAAIFRQGDSRDRVMHILAEMVGTTRSRVNAFIGKFKKLGFIEENSGVLHVNPARLHVVDDGDRHVSIAAFAANPQAPKSEERHLPLAG
jgi:hypothetical protein